MNISPPKKAYVYQPMAPRPDGRFYGVAGLEAFGLSYDEAKIKGITKSDADLIARECNEHPLSVSDIVCHVRARMADEWTTECGCRFESLLSNAVLLCEECSKLPCHNPHPTHNGGESDHG